MMSLGFIFVLDILRSNNLLGDNIFLSVFLIILLSVYAIPLYFLISFLVHRWRVNIKLAIISIFMGIFATGYIPAHANEFFDTSGRYPWLEAIVAGTGEEIIKLFVALLVLITFNKKNLKASFIVGLGVGLGFQIMEDVNYILGEDNEQKMIVQYMDRVSGSIVSHWTYTAIMTVGFAGLFFINSTSLKLRMLFFVSAPIILHILWNSPINEGIVTVLFISITLLIIIILFDFVDKYKSRI